MNRRHFLWASASAAGGLLITVALGCRDERKPAPAPAPEPAPPRPPAPGAELNAYLRIDPDGTVTVLVPEAEMGQGILTGVARIVAEELDADWATVRAEHAPADTTRYGRQSTGGSTSTRGNWEALRTAGATARAMLIAAAAGKLGVPASELATEPGQVVHAGSGRRAGYGELAAAAATLAPPTGVPLRDAATFRLIGTSAPRLDTRAKITGAAVYGLDVRVAGMKVAVIARPPVIGGAVASVDDAAARRVPGVLDVVRVPTGVAVIADHTWAAIQGRAALAVTWDAGPNAGLSSQTISAALAEAAPGGTVARLDGDPAKVIARARKKLTATYEVPYLAHTPMEPLNATVRLTGDGAEIWVGTQSPSAVQKTAGELLGVAPDKIIVHTTFMGGGFGRRSQTDFVAEAVEVARAAKVTVQLVWTREDDVRGGMYRPAALSVCEGALDADGWPVAWIQRIACPSILERFGPLDQGIDGTAVEGVTNLPYTIADLQVTYANPKLPLSVWFWRSVGSSQNAWSTECFLDELARAGGKDPVELRRRLLPEGSRHRRVLDAAVERAGWGTPLPDGVARGVAVHESFGSVVAEIVEVSVVGNAPRVHRVVCAIDCGIAINPQQIEAQMESGIAYGLTAALHGAIDLDGGAVRQSNFHDYRVVKMSDMPRVEVVIVPSTDPPGGVGEPGLPPLAPAVCNALLVLTGTPIRRLPIRLA